MKTTLTDRQLAIISEIKALKEVMKSKAKKYDRAIQSVIDGKHDDLLGEKSCMSDSETADLILMLN